MTGSVLSAGSQPLCAAQLAALASIEWPEDELSAYATLHGSLFGIPDDLFWRAEHTAARRTRVRTGIRVAAWTAGTAIIAATIWILPLMWTGTLPPLPDKPRVKMAAPPPPPPPPCAPPGYPQFKPCSP